ncbi:TPA: metallophosphoesterase [Streptococcus suis]
MKKKVIPIVLLISLILVWRLSVHQSVAAYPSVTLTKEDQIWIISDLHYLSPTLFDSGEAFSYIEKTAAGKELRYGKERMDALLEQVKRDKPKHLLVSGDLTLNGEKQSMLELAGYFGKMEKAGTQVQVIPGNHDIASGWARAFKGDQQEVVAQVSHKDFAEIFVDFGYNQAANRDAHSLSYLSKVSSNLWFIMLDSNIYSDGMGKGGPKTNGRIKKETLDWMEEQLQAAEEAGVQALPVVHHNALRQHHMLSKGYTLDNTIDVKRLLDRYGVQFGFSGHTHAQNIVSEDLGKTTYTEVVNGAFSVYPAVIGQVTVDKSGLDYQKGQLDTAFWAKNAQPTNPDLRELTAHMQSVFDNSSDIMVHRMMYDEGWYSTEVAESISRFMVPVNRAYFSGEKIDQNWLAKDVYPSQAYKELSKVNPKSFLYDYAEHIFLRSQERDVEKFFMEMKP